MVGRQPKAPAAFTPGEIPGTHFQRLSRLQGTWFCRKEPRKKSQVTPPGIDPGTVRPVALRLNHYATPRPPDSEVRQLIILCGETATEGRRRMRVNLFLYWNLLHNWDISARAITLNETCSALYGKERQMLKIFRNLLLSEELSVIPKSAICY